MSETIIPKFIPVHIPNGATDCYVKTCSCLGNHPCDCREVDYVGSVLYYPHDTPNVKRGYAVVVSGMNGLYKTGIESDSLAWHELIKHWTDRGEA